MTLFRRFLFLFIMCWYALSMNAMVYDNRFFPLYPRIYSRIPEKPSVVMADLMFMFAHHGVNDNDDGDGIPEIVGKYFFNKLAEALVLLGKPNPLAGTTLDQFIGREIPYDLHSKIQTEGMSFFWNAGFMRKRIHFSFGISCFFMHVFSRILFELGRNNLGLSAEQIAHLDTIRRQAQESIGLHAPKWSKFGFSDIDVYFRAGRIWEYCYKMRRIDAGVRVGLLVPSGVRRDIDNPASVPFGGNGHWGVYTTLDLELELKEDWKAGAWIRVSKRFEKTINERGPLAGEHPWFAALKAPLDVNPGLTGVISPYFCLEDIRDGLGIQAKYTVVIHEDDVISDARKDNRKPEVQLRAINNVSEWTAEYLTFNVFYDFAKVRVDKWYAPIVSLMWDIPTDFFLADRVVKTNRISLGVQVSF